MANLHEPVSVNGFSRVPSSPSSGVTSVKSPLRLGARLRTSRKIKREEEKEERKGRILAKYPPALAFDGSRPLLGRLKKAFQMTDVRLPNKYCK